MLKLCIDAHFFVCPIHFHSICESLGSRRPLSLTQTLADFACGKGRARAIAVGADGSVAIGTSTGEIWRLNNFAGAWLRARWWWAAWSGWGQRCEGRRISSPPTQNAGYIFKTHQSLSFCTFTNSLTSIFLGSSIKQYCFPCFDRINMDNIVCSST
jgi:hypothetical protein